MSDLFIEIEIKWNNQVYKPTGLLGTHTINDLKQELYKLTQVHPQRQKILGLKTSKSNANDDTLLQDLLFKPGYKFMMMGSREESISEANKIPENLPQVLDDLTDISDGVVEVGLHEREEYLSKISKRVREYKIQMMNEPRQGKKLLVLDIDYTLFDHVSSAERVNELMRPYLHEFLTQAYEHYDIVIWSATSYKWIEVKMRELGVSTNVNYKVSFYLCGAAMISVHLPEYGLLNVKPLRVIWDKFPQYYSHKNTIMFDDLKRNFLLNPQNGLRIAPYKNCHLIRDQDKELLKLSIYLKMISTLDDFTVLKHKHWERFIEKH